MREGPVADEVWPVDQVAEVIGQRLAVDDEESRDLARRLRELFSSKESLEDADLEKQDRALLWRLMSEGIVTTGVQVRPHPEHGRPWRYYNWQLVPPSRLLEEEEVVDRSEDVPGEHRVYDSLPSHMWSRTPAGV